MVICEHIKAKGKPEYTPLFTHISHVIKAIEKIADNTSLDKQIARMGAILHDIGKASPVFQERLNPDYKRKESDKTFRHELASLFFLSLFDPNIHPQLIEMIAAHHKSVEKDPGLKGVLDLEENVADVFALHKIGWENWSEDALKILGAFGIPTRPIPIEEAADNYNKCVDYLESKIQTQGYSQWKGLLMAADHFASALLGETDNQLKRIFQIPDLGFFERKHPLYPLSMTSAESKQKHTVVVACTGAGKTDFLFRRCSKRIFYTLPFQASINAMYKRIIKDLKDTNPDLDIRILHSASSIVKHNGSSEEQVLQGLIGSEIKVLTPHQIAGIIFGTKTFEATILDLRGNDVILDEIHTYTEISRAIVIKMVEVLNRLGCRIHIGTATMPTDLYNKIIHILRKENVYEVKLQVSDLDKFDRHIVHKLNQWEAGAEIIKSAVNEEKKILVVCNRVSAAQERYEYYREKHPDIPVLLIHSRFKRGDRNIKEKQLIGLDENGQATHEYNTTDKACIVISTQVVEVSLDISFDLMITETAPLDALIQRFGRVNRKRTTETIGKYKSVYVIPPPEDFKEALPYDADILKTTFEILPDGELLRERELQHKIDEVFPEVNVMDIETHSIFKKDGNLVLDYLTHRPKSYLLELLEIDSVSCIVNSDIEKYIHSGFEERLMMEIPARYWQVKNFPQCEYGNRPYIMPDHSYYEETGFDIEKAKQPFSQEENIL